MYDTDDLIRQAIVGIESDKDVVFQDDVIALLPCSPETFYAKQLHKSEKIKAALLKNRTSIKKKLRKKWGDNDNAATNIALYKLIGSDDERRKISNNDSVEHTLTVPTGEITFKIISSKNDATD